jgi:hypothetical protein
VIDKETLVAEESSDDKPEDQPEGQW